MRSFGDWPRSGESQPFVDWYEFFIDDDRFATMPRLVEKAQSLESARRRAREILSDSIHRRKVMVYQNLVYLFAVTPNAHPPV